jgi:hypothetical protein
VHPAAIRPVEDHEALGLQAGLQPGPHLLEDEVQLVVGVVHHGDAERVDGLVDLGHADRRQHARVERAQAHLAHDVGIVAGHAVPRRGAR